MPNASIRRGRIIDVARSRMTALLQDSFDSAAIGVQCSSQKATMPAFSFGTGSRERAIKNMYISKKHDSKKAVMQSPGPVYSVPSCISDGPKYSFGTEEQRTTTKAQYPDTSVDLTCSNVDSQQVKFDNPKGVHFGTESRSNPKNGEVVRVHPTAALGTCSPIALDYIPDDTLTKEGKPEYTFGPKSARLGEKATSRLTVPKTGTPRYVGPGSHSVPPGLGKQPVSARKSGPAWSFGGRKHAGTPRTSEVSMQLLDPAPDVSSLGRQVVSNQKSSPQCGFGTSTRDHQARTFLVTTDEDKGAALFLPKQRLHLDLPKLGKLVSKPGM